MEPSADLVSVLTESQRIGLIGPGSLAVAIDQAHRFAAALPHPDTGRLRVVDVGSGGGLPGLVVVVDRPDIDLTMVDRRGRACDLLRRAVRGLGVADRATVVEADLEGLGLDPAWRAQFDAATARGVGTPSMVAELVIPLLRPGGRLVVSTVGLGETWPDAGLARLGARVVERLDGLIVVESGECPSAYPRRRRRPELFDPA
jgi:16S rRNA (guanine527-N7)-methyltransferase